MTDIDFFTPEFFLEVQGWSRLRYNLNLAYTIQRLTAESQPPDGTFHRVYSQLTGWKRDICLFFITVRQLWTWQLTPESRLVLSDHIKKVMTLLSERFVEQSDMDNIVTMMRIALRVRPDLLETQHLTSWADKLRKNQD